MGEGSIWPWCCHLSLLRLSLCYVWSHVVLSLIHPVHCCIFLHAQEQDSLVHTFPCHSSLCLGCAGTFWHPHSMQVLWASCTDHTHIVFLLSNTWCRRSGVLPYSGTSILGGKEKVLSSPGSPQVSWDSVVLLIITPNLTLGVGHAVPSHSLTEVKLLPLIPSNPQAW